ncbi:tRNA(fMet)-specific endonuclease VapC [subsurface metagenome]
MILLDSSVLIELFRKKEKKKTLFYKLSQSDKDLSISTITYYEIGIGNRKSHSDFWDSLCENLIVIPFDKACSDKAIAIYLDLLKLNKMIDLADLLIGATALTHNISIATLNIKHFERIKDLEILK